MTKLRPEIAPTRNKKPLEMYYDRLGRYREPKTIPYWPAVLLVLGTFLIGTFLIGRAVL